MDDVLQVLGVCGLGVQADRAAVAQRLGVDNLESLADVEDADIDNLVRALARGGAGRGNQVRVIPVVKAKNIKTAVFWVKDRIRRGKAVDPLEFDIGTMRSMAERKKVEEEMDNADPNDKPFEFSGKQKDYNDFVDALWRWGMSHKSANGAPIAYTMRRIAPQGTAVLALSQNFVDVLIAECKHEGALFDKDNQVLFSVISNCCKDGESKAQLSGFRNSQHGVGAIDALAQHFAGSSGKARDLARARGSLENIFYNNERSLPFDRFKVIVESDYQAIADSGGQEYTDEHKVTQVLTKMQNCKIPGPDGSNQFGHIASQVRQNYLNNFTGAMNFIQDQISFFVGPAPKERRRAIGSVDTRGGGRSRHGRGGRSRGRDGRGHGRGDRRGRHHGRGGGDRSGSRGGSGRGDNNGRGRVHFGNGYVEINGVRVDANSIDNFTDDQVRQMGSSFSVVREMRRQRHISVVNTDTSGDANTVISDVTGVTGAQTNQGQQSQSSTGNRGGQNGRSFGPPPRQNQS